MARRPMLFSTLRGLARDPEGKVLLGSAITTVAVGTVVYMVLEGWSAIDALYFSVVTLATVGFGDLHPTTDEAKLFTVGYIIFGVGILAGFVSEVARRRTDRTSTPVIDEVEAAVASRRHGSVSPLDGEAASATSEGTPPPETR
jgi:hypothetical protein